MINPLSAAHLEMEIAAKTDVIMLLEVLDIQDDTALLAACPEALAGGLGGCFGFNSILVDADWAQHFGIADD
jgi:hypothetical protein